MSSIVTEILHWPLFPIGIVALLGLLYWRGIQSSRAEKREKAANAALPVGGGSTDEPKNP
jgi:hypothetical protein